MDHPRRRLRANPRPMRLVLLAVLLGGLAACGGQSFSQLGGIEKVEVPHDEVVEVSTRSLTFCCDPDKPFPQRVGSFTITKRPGVKFTEHTRDTGVDFLIHEGEDALEEDPDEEIVLSRPVFISENEQSVEVEVHATACEEGTFTIKTEGERATGPGPLDFEFFTSTLQFTVNIVCDCDHSESFENALTRIFGQRSGTAGDPNQGGAVGAGTLNQPGGNVATFDSAQGLVLWVADTSNHRAVRYSIGTSEGADGPDADLVKGQFDFTSFQPGTTLFSFNRVRSIAIDQGLMFLADARNNRMLTFIPVPASLSETPLVVLGQQDFVSNTPAAGADGMAGPSHLSVGNGRVAVADSPNNRVLLYNSIQTSSGAPADVVLGQPDADQNAPGSGRGGMNAPQGVWTDGTRVVVSDTNNHRLFVWDTWPDQNGQLPDRVIGQPDFDTNTPQAPAVGLRNPMGIDSDGTSIVVADAGHHRVVGFDGSFEFGNFDAWNFVVGQASCNNTAPNDDDQDGVEDATPSRRTLKQPRGVHINGSSLFVTDSGNSRVVEFKNIDFQTVP